MAAFAPSFWNTKSDWQVRVSGSASATQGVINVSCLFEEVPEDIKVRQVRDELR